MWWEVISCARLLILSDLTGLATFGASKISTSAAFHFGTGDGSPLNRREAASSPKFQPVLSALTLDDETIATEAGARDREPLGKQDGRHICITNKSAIHDLTLVSAIFGDDTVCAVFCENTISNLYILHCRVYTRSALLKFTPANK
jgi:hypothetical protein